MTTRSGVRDGVVKVYQSRLPAAAVVFLGGIGCVFAVFYPNAYTVMVPPALVASGAIAYHYDPETDRSLRSFTVWIPAKHVYTAYFTVVAVAVLLYHVNGYTRTFPVHLLTVLLYGLVILLLFTDASDWAALGMLLGVALLQRTMAYYAGAIQMGMDSLFHTRIAALISEAGSLEPLSFSKYWYAPVYHILTSVGQQVLGTSIRASSLVLVGFVLAMVPALLVYYFTGTYWDRTYGVVAALLFVTADYSVGWSVMTVPTSLGAVFFAIAIVSLHNYFLTGDKREFLVTALAITTLASTHQVSLFVTVVCLTTYIVAYQLLNEDVGGQLKMVVSFFAVIILLDWITTGYRGPRGESGFFLASVILQFLGRLEGARTRPEVTDLGNAVPPGASALTPIHIVGLALLIGFGILGGLMWLRDQRRQPSRTAVPLGLAVAVMFGISFAGPVVDIDLFIPRRWFVFIYIPLAVFAAAGIAVVRSSIGPAIDSNVVVGALVVCLLPMVLFMSFNYMGSLDDPVLDAPESQRFAMSDTETAAYESAIEYDGKRLIVGDFLVHQTIQRYYGHQASRYVFDREGNELTTGETLYIYREYSKTASNSYVLEYQPGFRTRVYGPLPATPPGSKVYANDEVAFFASGE